MKVAAYQAPLDARDDAQVISQVRQQVYRCEQLGVQLLCCPEALLGGLADYVDEPGRIAIDTSGDDLARVLAPLASNRVAVVLGFTERGSDGRLYNAAALFADGKVLGIYRKMHPAINRSVYRGGVEVPVFTFSGITVGILICRDSLFPEPAESMVSRGAQILLVPTNNGMPPMKGGSELVAESRNCDIARALTSGVPVVRADVAGVHDELVSHGSSGIVNRDGHILATSRAWVEDLVIGDVD
ncbi:MAG TPA: nitrilase-related carbon-nitrogen hydrolase [Gemmatales bacterium]|nr:nitrilase-related carbon-nitrogen hydrolase [Gemmatales bacterium]